MARLENPVGGRRDARLIEQAKAQDAKRTSRLRSALYGDGFPPGQAPLKDPVMQRRRLEELAQTTGLSPAESAKLAELQSQGA